jgi:hypothetical protein
MNKLITIILIIFLWLNSCAQIENIAINKTINKYATDSLIYTLINFEIVNNSTNNYILWIEKDTINNLCNELKVKKYFHKRKGDFTLAEIIYENSIIRQGFPTIFFSFYKIIKPNNKFYLTVIKKGEITDTTEFINRIEKHIAIVKDIDSKFMPEVSLLEVENYQGISISIFAELLNL